MPTPGTPHIQDGSPPRAVILLSGGIDSAATLAAARAEGRDCHCLSFDYGQRHSFELQAARAVATSLGAAQHIVLALDLRAFGGSALTADIPVPKASSPSADTRSKAPPRDDGPIPVTYVPARNLVFLSIAAGFAETLSASEIHIGVNAVDYSGYPDCRPEFIRSFEQTVNLATKAGVVATADARDRAFRIRTPLMHLSKHEIIRVAHRLGVDLALTHSCYDPDERGRACARCDSCVIRARGFREAGLVDPTAYTPGDPVTARESPPTR